MLADWNVVHGVGGTWKHKTPKSPDPIALDILSMAINLYIQLSYDRQTIGVPLLFRHLNREIGD